MLDGSREGWRVWTNEFNSCTNVCSSNPNDMSGTDAAVTVGSKSPTNRTPHLYISFTLKTKGLAAQECPQASAVLGGHCDSNTHAEFLNSDL